MSSGKYEVDKGNGDLYIEEDVGSPNVGAVDSTAGSSRRSVGAE